MRPSAATSASRRHVRRYASRGANGPSALLRDPNEGDGDTAVITMDDVLSELGKARIDVLKVDIEGAEEELFADCASWIERVGVLVNPIAAER